MQHISRALLGLTIVLSLLAAACGDGSAGEQPAGGDPGAGGSAITISGSSTVEPISAANAQKWNEDNPDIPISVSGPGTGDGFQMFCNDETDISDASRPIQQEEIDLCAQNGIEFIELKIGIDGLSVITSTQNDQVQCLSFPDLYALLGPESTGFESWSDANELGLQVGGSGDYPQAPLVVTGPGEESGTYDSFVEIVIEDIAEERGQEPVIRPDYQSSPNDNVIIDGVAGSPASLGWVGFAFAQEAQNVKLLAVEAEEGSGCVEPTSETIADGTFPISRPLFIYVSAAKAEENPALVSFVDFYLSDEGLASVSEVGYVSLQPDAIEQTRQVWESRETGTREASG